MMAVTIRHSAAKNGSDLFQGRVPATYTESEQAFSSLVQSRLEQLLRGELNTLLLLRRYHREPRRLGVPCIPRGVNGHKLRQAVVETILIDLLRFLHTGYGLAGGPIAQSRAEGRILERQVFTTRFPHILIERVDRYDEHSRKPLETEWVVKRIQNQQAEVRTNRALNAVNLGIELMKVLVR